MNKHKIKHIINSYLAPMIFSFVPVLSHFIIGLYMMKQENTANLGAIICVVGIVCFFCWWFTSFCKIFQINGLKRNQRLKKNENNNYEDAYEEWEDKFENEKNKGRW